MGEEAEPGPSADRECLGSRRGTSHVRTIASLSLEGPLPPSAGCCSLLSFFPSDLSSL